jgi:hypothetical protein
MGDFNTYDKSSNIVAGRVLRDKSGTIILDNDGRTYAIPENFDFQAALDWGAALRDRPIVEKMLALKNAFNTDSGFLDAQRSRDGNRAVSEAMGRRVSTRPPPIFTPPLQDLRA